MNVAKLLDELGRRPLLCDGAMGTQLMVRGLAAGSCGEKWNVDRPADVEAIHRAYRQAGCDLVTTNTFGGTSLVLARHGLERQVDALNRAGAQVASRAAGDSGWVLGDIGPFGGFLEPVGDTTSEQAAVAFRDQAVALAAGGADAFIVETFSDPAEVALAIAAARSASPRLPIVATYAFERGDGVTFRTMTGADVRTATAAAISAGAHVVGANCGTSLSLDDYLRLARDLVAAAGRTAVILQPNAGSPQSVDGKLVYPASPADMAGLVPELLRIGVRIIGGCCGTTPEHLRAMKGKMP